MFCALFIQRHGCLRVDAPHENARSGKVRRVIDAGYNHGAGVSSWKVDPPIRGHAP